MADKPRSNEIRYPNPRSGILMLLFGILLCLLFIGDLILGIRMVNFGPPSSQTFGIVLLLAEILVVIAAVLVFRGLVLVNPNQSKVILLFGRYQGTLRDDGFFWINPFTVRRPVSLRAHNFGSETLKVNDRRGNPIEIGAVVVWRVHDTAQAVFDVEDFQSYVEVQTESALRHLASTHPYDAPGDNELSLRGGHEDINNELQEELTRRLAMAGIEALEGRIAHLAYAPEIAGAMLRRQQADAIIDARTRIVDGAVGMVKMALGQLEEQGVVELDDERRATMVSNLLVVLCSEKDTTPVINAGSLYT